MVSISRLACCSRVWAESRWPRVDCICAIIRMNSTYLQDMWGRATLDPHYTNHMWLDLYTHSLTLSLFLKHHCCCQSIYTCNSSPSSPFPLLKPSHTQTHSPSSKQQCSCQHCSLPSVVVSLSQSSLVQMNPRHLPQSTQQSHCHVLTSLSEAVRRYLGVDPGEER